MKYRKQLICPISIVLYPKLADTLDQLIHFVVIATAERSRYSHARTHGHYCAWGVYDGSEMVPRRSARRIYK